MSYVPNSNTLYSPILTFALPVRNGERLLPQLLDSLLAQDFTDFEIVISDNASTDRTGDICQEYAQRDRRIRYHRNPENIGLMPNFNRLIDLARGKYMRWIGWDDWLEPSYARKCVDVLESRPDVIGVTTYQDFLEDDGSRDYAEYTGPRLDYAQVHKRYQRMVWFMTNDFRFIDPIYTMIRRDVLAKTGGHKPGLCADQALAIEFSVLGAFAHIPECLAHRGKTPYASMTRDQLLKQNFHNQFNLVKNLTPLDNVVAFWEPLNQYNVSLGTKVRCIPAIASYAWIVGKGYVLDAVRSWLRPVKRTVKRSVLALTRA